MDAPPVTGKILVLTIKPEKLKREDLIKPALLVARLPRNSQFLSVVSMPNILEVMGMGSGGGAPGFSVLVPAMGKEEPKQPDINRFIATYVPNADVQLPNPLGLHIGTAKSAGIVLNYFEVLPSEDEQTRSFEEVAEALKEKGFVVLELVPYETPAILTQRAAPGTPG